ncbi:MAG: TonB-dependent receptor, partial [Candidatus Omnitrophica bacterium]|nr:TonB-dependent receptor [Candidatus Omnitrophota bacterium]
FYSDSYPHEQEHTDTRFFNLKAHINNTILDIDSSLFYRRHSDKFILDSNRPNWYVNYHTSYSYGADLETLKRLSWGTLSAGAGILEEKISSTNLGEHKRDSQAVYAQLQSLKDKRASYDLGLRLDHYQTWGWQTSPSLSLGYEVIPQLRLKTSGGYSFRIPSFTELYYSSPANVGNEDLTPEKAWSGELGLDYAHNKFSAELNYFRRWAEDLIGWARASSNLAWGAQNFAEVDTEGIEVEFAYAGISTGYTFQDLNSSVTGLNTKYTLDFLQHHAFLGLNLEFAQDIMQSVRFSYKQRKGQRPYFLIDTRLSKRIEKEDDFDLELFLDVTNLLNTSYSEQGNVRMPGRWVMGGVRLRR